MKCWVNPFFSQQSTPSLHPCLRTSPVFLLSHPLFSSCPSRSHHLSPSLCLFPLLPSPTRLHVPSPLSLHSLVPSHAAQGFRPPRHTACSHLQLRVTKYPHYRESRNMIISILHMSTLTLLNPVMRWTSSVTVHKSTNTVMHGTFETTSCKTLLSSDKRRGGASTTSTQTRESHNIDQVTQNEQHPTCIVSFALVFKLTKARKLRFQRMRDVDATLAFSL